MRVSRIDASVSLIVCLVLWRNHLGLEISLDTFCSHWAAEGAHFPVPLAFPSFDSIWAGPLELITVSGGGNLAWPGSHTISWGLGTHLGFCPAPHCCFHVLNTREQTLGWGLVSTSASLAFRLQSGCEVTINVDVPSLFFTSDSWPGCFLALFSASSYGCFLGSVFLEAEVVPLSFSFLFVLRQILLCSPGWAWTQAPLLPVLRLQACISTSALCPVLVFSFSETGFLYYASLALLNLLC